MSDADRQSSTPLEPAIRRGRLKLIIHDVSEDELESLERGSPVSSFLNLAGALTIFAWSTAISFSISLATTNIPLGKTFVVFVLVMVIAYLAGATFSLLWFLLWFFLRKSSTSVAQKIRKRMPPEGIPASSSVGTADDRPTTGPPGGG